MINATLICKKKNITETINLAVSMQDNIHLMFILKSVDDIRNDMILENTDILIFNVDATNELESEHILKLKSTHSHLKILVISRCTEESQIRKCFRYGADGYILEGSEHEIEEALLTISSGEYYFCEAITKVVMAGLTQQQDLPDDAIQLTRREKEVLQLIVEGLTSKQIGQQLYIAESTVDTHRRNIIAKTGVANSKALSKYAYENRLLSNVMSN